MALFGGRRDIGLFRSINRELLGNIINQQCSIYKIKLNETYTNIYGEAIGDKLFDGPFLFNCLISRGEQSQTDDDFGPSFDWPLEFRFLRDDLLQTAVVLEIGDIIMYNDSYYEVDNINENEYFMGKNPDYANNPNPLNSGLENYGWDRSIIAKAHYIPADKTGITRERIV